MANESAVPNISELTTTTTCPGCEKELNLLVEHLRVTISPSRSVIEVVDAALVGAETDEEGNITALGIDVTGTGDTSVSRESFYVGTRGGAGTVEHVHNYTCLADWATVLAGQEEFQVGETVKITPLDVDPQTETRGND